MSVLILHAQDDIVIPFQLGVKVNYLSEYNRNT